MTILVRLAYDGTDFHGFARQGRPERPVRTVQGALEAALLEIYHQRVPIRGASRTDAGVHALGQIVGWEPPLPIPPRGLMLGLLSKLPDDLGVLAVWEALLPDEQVDPRFWNLGKRYRYRIRTSQRRSPLTARDEWHLPRRLDLPAMQAAAAHFVGEHDFANFRASACQSRTTVRRLHAVTVTGRRAADDLPQDPPCLRDDGRPELLEDPQPDVLEGPPLHPLVQVVVHPLEEARVGGHLHGTPSMPSPSPDSA